MINKYKFFLFTENADKLVKFYTDVLGFTIVSQLKLPLDYGYALKISDGYEIWLANHSEVKGANKDKYRHLLNLYVDSVNKYYEKVRNIEGVQIIQAPTPMSNMNPEEKERWVVTITDPEGNMLQFMGLP